MEWSTESDWERLSADPDPERDLGYELEEWDVVTTEQRGLKHLVFLPGDGTQIHREAFIIAKDDAVYDVYEMR
ncbi:MAG: hypothetical protein ACQETB_04670 [Halobacteriota archaeon]